MSKELQTLAIGVDEYEICDAKARSQLIRIKPEQFGAKGDGTTNDTQAFKDMLEYVNSIVTTKEFVGESSCKDYSKISFEFSKQYAVSEPINFQNAYGLILDGLKLIATNDFVGDYLLGITGVTRQININNCYLNGNLIANKCLYINDYTLGIKINNCEITRFYNHGIYMLSKGHETIITNTKINQVEWGELSQLNSLIPEGNGIGLYLETQRYDNHFTNLIINYCRTKLVEINGGSNMFEGCHFYGSRVDILGQHNTMSNCSFDTTKLYWGSMNKIFNSIFFGLADTESFIYLLGTNELKYQYDLSMLIGNSFIGTENNQKPINFGELTGNVGIECIANSFDRVTPFCYQSGDAYIPEKWKGNKYSGFDTSNGSVRIGDWLMQYGTIQDNTPVKFPIAFEYNIQQVLLNTHYAAESTPYPTAINNEGFTPANVNGETWWIAFGRMWK